MDEWTKHTDLYSTRISKESVCFFNSTKGYGACDKLLTHPTSQGYQGLCAVVYQAGPSIHTTTTLT